MPMNAHFEVRRATVLSRALVVSLALTMMVAGCKKKPAVVDDAGLNTQVQSRLLADQNLSGQSIQSSVAGGVVTLSGSVASDAVRTIADGDAVQVVGVTKVIDNLVVQAPATTAAALPPAPVATQTYAPVANSAKGKKTAPAAAMQAQATPSVNNATAPIVRSTPAPVQAAPPPPPPAPVAHNITLPAGTDIPVTITQTLSSETARTGDRFSGVISNDVRLDGMVVLAKGTPVTGHVDEVQDAAHFKGSSLLSVSLSAIDRKGVHIEVSTESYAQKGVGRGKNTAEKIGGGAAVGALLGGIFGGGKGAAIGAAAGGGVGAGANTVTRGQQVEIPSESVVRFRLTEPISVRVTMGSAGN